MAPASRPWRGFFLVWVVLATSLVYACSGTDKTTRPESPRATRIEVSPATGSFASLGQTLLFNARVFDQFGGTMAGGAVVWSSSNPGVATVSASGGVAAVGDGTATISASALGLSGSASVTVEQVAAFVEVTPTSVFLTALGEPSQLTAQVTDAGGSSISGAATAWASDDPSIASVDSNGLVTATGPGTTTVSATSAPVQGSALITVTLPPHSITLSPGELALSALGETTMVTAEVFHAGGGALPGASVAWSSDNPSVAAVDVDGLVTAGAVGQATITATSGSASAELPVTVTQVPASVEMSPTSLFFNALGQASPLAATVRDSGGNAIPGAVVVWSSSAEGVATVDGNGLVTSVANGTTTVTASFGGLSASAAVTVDQVVDSVTVTPPVLGLGGIAVTGQLTALVLDVLGSEIPGAVVSWFSGNEAVATVDASGLVTAVSVGEATVTASSGITSGQVVVTVTRPVASVEITPDGADLKSINETVQLTAVVKDASGVVIDGAAVTWASSDEPTVLVDENGTVTASGVGVAQVTASFGGVSDVITVSVTQVAAEVRISPPSATLTSIGGTEQLTALVLDALGTVIPGAPVVWDSGDDGVVTVSTGGLVTAVANGTTEMSATSGTVSGSASMTVAQVPGSVEVEPMVLSLVGIGSAAQLTATVRDAGGTEIAGAPVNWSSGNPLVAVLDGAGVVTAIGEGFAVVTAESGGFEANAAVTVTLPPPASVQLLANPNAAIGVPFFLTLMLDISTPLPRDPGAIAFDLTWDPAVMEVLDAPPNTINSSEFWTAVPHDNGMRIVVSDTGGLKDGDVLIQIPFKAIGGAGLNTTFDLAFIEVFSVVSGRGFYSQLSEFSAVPLTVLVN